MNDLLTLAIKAQGGLDLWRKFYTGSAHLVVGGVLWEMKGQSGVIEEVDVKINLLEQKVSHIPGNSWHTVYTPDRVAIQTDKGEIIEELYNPRGSFQGHVLETKWSRLQLAYFVGYAMWNYFNSPFQFVQPGFETKEIEPWEENKQIWRRLLVKWPKHIHTHSNEQVFYLDTEGLIRRLDYSVEVSGNVPAAHYLFNYRSISGIKIPTKRIVYLIGENNNALLDGPQIVTIELKDLQLT